MSSNFRGILSQLNRQNSIESMRCLADIKTKDDVEAAAKDKYLFGMTAGEFAERFPGIDVTKVFCPKAVLFPPSFFYYDAEKYILLNTPIMGGMLVPSTDEKDVAQHLRAVIAKSEAAYAEKDYGRLIIPSLSEQSGNMAMKICRDMLDREEPSAKLYKTVLDAYSFCDRGSAYLKNGGLEKLMACKSEEQEQKTKDALEEDLAKYGIDGDELTIYRGEGSESTPHTEACSWSLDIARASAFASDCEDPAVYCGTVRKEDVLEYLSDRGESEVIVNPSKIKNAHRMIMYTYSEFEEVVLARSYDKHHVFPETTRGQSIINDSKHAFRHVDVEDHTAEHAIRVALLASYMFRIGPMLAYAGATPKTFARVSDIYERLVFAAEYHDAGRTDNERNKEHGAAGYRAYVDDYGEDAIVEFLCTYHCADDEQEARSFWKKQFAANKDRKLIWDAYIILRDADALDRVRFGTVCRDFTNGLYLRTNTAKRLLLVSLDLANRKIS